MKKNFSSFILLIMLSFALYAEEDNLLHFSDDLPGPKELLSILFRPMEQMSFIMSRYFTITRRGPDCRHYYAAEGPLEFTACIQNHEKQGHWMQRLTYLVGSKLPLSIIIEHSEKLALTHENLWNWRFLLPSGAYYTFTIPRLGFTAVYQNDSNGTVFQISYAQETFSFRETAPSPNKITRIYQATFFENFHQCQTTVIPYLEAQRAYYQTDQSSDIAPYLFQQKCLIPLLEQFDQGGKHLISLFKKHLSVD